MRVRAMRMRREIDRCGLPAVLCVGIDGHGLGKQVWKLRDKHMRQLMEFEVKTIYNFTVHYANHVRYGIRYGIQNGHAEAHTYSFTAHRINACNADALVGIGTVGGSCSVYRLIGRGGDIVAAADSEHGMARHTWHMAHSMRCGED